VTEVCGQDPDHLHHTAGRDESAGGQEARVVEALDRPLSRGRGAGVDLMGHIPDCL